jgi:hypothetical protein
VNFDSTLPSTCKRNQQAAPILKSLGGVVTIKTLVLFVTLQACLLQAPRVTAQSASPSAASTTTQSGVDQDIKLFREDIRSKKKQLIASNLKLTDAEATKFWPIYDRYTADLVKINDEKYAVMKEYANNWGSVTDDQAVNMSKRAIGVDEQVAQLRTKYIPMFNQAIPGKKTATFFQIERRIQAMIDLQLASQMPLVQDQQ